MAIVRGGIRGALLVGACVFVAGLSPGLSAATARSVAANVCPTFNGPKWFFATSNTGTKYQLETSGGYSCAKAAAWVKKLAAKTLPSSKENVHYRISGPAGFDCEASPDRHAHAFSGSCEKPVQGSQTRLGFDWTSSFF